MDAVKAGTSQTMRGGCSLSWLRPGAHKAERASRWPWAGQGSSDTTRGGGGGGKEEEEEEVVGLLQGRAAATQALLPVHLAQGMLPVHPVQALLPVHPIPAEHPVEQQGTRAWRLEVVTMLEPRSLWRHDW